MGRNLHRLSARGVAALSMPGKHSDGGGLVLVVEKTGTKRWIFRFKWGGRVRDLGLGGYPAVSLARARELADEARKLLAAGQDPIAIRKAAPAAVPTFKAFADDLLASIEGGFRSPIHRRQWRQSIADHCRSIHDKPIDQVEVADVIGILRPIWLTKAETAGRVRGRLERIFDAAAAQGLRPETNPAVLRSIRNLLPTRPKLQRGHHRALPYAEVPDLMARLRAVDIVSALALRFLILTASRTGEVLGAKWDEIDKQELLWRVPPERMKANRLHVVPLPRAVLDMLITEDFRGQLVFPGARRGESLSAMALTMQLRRMEVSATVHGFRSSFRDWVAEETDYPGELAEMSLAHLVGDAVERAYRRGAQIEKRRKLMTDWAVYLGEIEHKPAV